MPVNPYPIYLIRKLIVLIIPTYTCNSAESIYSHCIYVNIQTDLSVKRNNKKKKYKTYSPVKKDTSTSISWPQLVNLIPGNIINNMFVHSCT